MKKLKMFKKKQSPEERLLDIILEAEKKSHENGTCWKQRWPCPWCHDPDRKEKQEQILAEMYEENR